MSWAGSEIRCRSQATTSALPARACHGQTPERGRAPPPDRQVGAALADVVQQPRELGGVERAVAVHERDVLGRGRLQTRVHRGAVPGPALGHDRRAVAPGDGGGVVGRAVVDDDHAVGVGHARQQPLQRRTLVAAREHEVTGRVHVSQRRDAGTARAHPSGLRSADGYGLRRASGEGGSGPGAGARRPRDGGAGGPRLGRARAVVPAAARRLGPARRLGHGARAWCSACWPWRYAVDLAARLSWGRLLVAAYAGGLAWMLALALVDGPAASATCSTTRTST